MSSGPTAHVRYHSSTASGSCTRYCRPSSAETSFAAVRPTGTAPDGFVPVSALPTWAFGRRALQALRTPARSGSACTRRPQASDYVVAEARRGILTVRVKKTAVWKTRRIEIESAWPEGQKPAIAKKSDPAQRACAGPSYGHRTMRVGGSRRSHRRWNQAAGRASSQWGQ